MNEEEEDFLLYLCKALSQIQQLHERYSNLLFHWNVLDEEKLSKDIGKFC